MGAASKWHADGTGEDPPDEVPLEPADRQDAVRGREIGERAARARVRRLGLDGLGRLVLAGRRRTEHRLGGYRRFRRGGESLRLDFSATDPADADRTTTVTVEYAATSC